ASSPDARRHRSEGNCPSQQEWMEGGKQHVPVGGRAEGQAPLLRAGGAGEDVREVGGGAPVPHVEDVRHHLAASGNRVTRLTAGDDGRHDLLAGGYRGGRTPAGGASCVVLLYGLDERCLTLPISY